MKGDPHLARGGVARFGTTWPRTDLRASRRRCSAGSLVLWWLAAALSLHPAAASAGRVQLVKEVAVADFGAQRLQVANGLGQISIVGWNRPDVRITASKSGITTAVAERIEVRVSRPGGRLIVVSTHLRRPRAAQSMARRRLHQLLERQRVLLGQLVSRPSASKQTLERLESVQDQLEAVQRDLAAEELAARPEPDDLSSAQVNLKLHAPDHLAVNARTLDDDLTIEGMVAGAMLSSHGGAIVVRRMAGQLRTWTASGDQRLTGIRGRVDAEGGQAHLRLEDIRGSVSARLTAGSIAANDIAGKRVDLRTIRGSIRLAGALSRTGRYALVTLNGDVEVRLPLGASAGLQGRAEEWDSGPFRPRAVRRGEGLLRARLGRGGPQLWLSSPRGRVGLIASAR